ncbi:probable E3 ubiquitin-protein ligase RHG1A [Chenopodium quinoa]|uniref:RING-type E3 ubiquitin transferase n=1 Tax=Chenopodium quinoa TaxID=63459 RepID=A0A803N9U3_CHEQI|nr:probable E3 ubiquitin-protein ligase RHG1A [Chenopodium quinoa]
MQGQRSTIGSLPDSINFDYGSPSSNVGVDQQTCWNNLRNSAESRLSDYRISATSSDTYMGGVSQDGRNFNRWNIGESSSTNPQVNYDDRMTQRGWSPSLNGSVDTALRLEEQRYEPTNFVSHTGVNLNLSNSQVVTGPSYVRTPDTESASQNRDLTDGNFHSVDDCIDCPNLSKSIGFESKFHPSASSSSDPFASSSDGGGFLVEEDKGRPGCSLDGRRLSCKRKTLEGNAGQSSTSGNCFARAEGGMWHAVPPRYDASSSVNVSISSESSPSINPPEQVNPRLGLGMGGGVPADSLRPLTVPGASESTQRNYRLRVNPSVQPDSLPNNSFSPTPGSSVARRPDSSSAHQPLRFVPITPLDLMSPNPPESSVPQSQPVISRVSALRRNMQSHRWNGATNLQAGSSSNSAPSGGDTVLPEDLNSRNLSRNIAEHPMFVPPVEPRNSSQTPTNWSLSSGAVGISRNIPSSSRTGSASASHTTPGPSWASHRHPSSQYSRRLSEYIRRSLLSAAGSDIAGQSSNSGQLHSGPSSSQDGILSSSGGNQGHNQSHSRSALWSERQGDGAVGIPYSLRALATAGEGRSRLVSELRNVLDIMRRGEGLRFEDVMILDQSVLFGMGDVHDQHRDMRLDVDNMSYEELLALEERIGSVCTGVTEDMILNRMKQRKYIHTMSDDQIEAEPCCICQENYNDGEDLGTLDCGHDFHRECVKQWLSHKNLCPICKTTGLAT